MNGDKLVRGLCGFMIQVAGFRCLTEALDAVAAGATHLGFPLGPGVRWQDVDIAGAGEIIRALDSKTVAVVITYLDDPGRIIDLCNAVGAGGVQLHGDADANCLEGLRAAAPELFVIKSLIVGGGVDPVEQGKKLSPWCDAFLTDTLDPETMARGATGMVHDWAVSRDIVRSVGRPVILAGGLNPRNVAQAIRRVDPAGVDAHTGLEDPSGRKDRLLMEAFCREARLAKRSG